MKNPIRQLKDFKYRREIESEYKGKIELHGEGLQHIPYSTLPTKAKSLVARIGIGSLSGEHADSFVLLESLLGREVHNIEFDTGWGLSYYKRNPNRK